MLVTITVERQKRQMSDEKFLCIALDSNGVCTRNGHGQKSSKLSTLLNIIF